MIRRKGQRGGVRLNSSNIHKAESAVIMSFSSISSLNLRTGREDSRHCDPIPYVCGICGVRHILGSDSFVLVRFEYILGKSKKEIVLCDRCSDVLADFVRFGPRVGYESNRWEICSRIARVSLVQDTLFCACCLKKDDTHLVIKFDDLLISGDKEEYHFKRVCARCAISYLSLLVANSGAKKYKYYCDITISRSVPAFVGWSE